MVTCAASALSKIVPVAVGSAGSVAFVAFNSLSVKVSSASTMVSSVVCTVTVFCVSPALNISGVGTAVKSLELAVSPGSTEVAMSTVVASVPAADSVTSNSTLSPSVAEACATCNAGNVRSRTVTLGSDDQSRPLSDHR